MPSCARQLATTAAGKRSSNSNLPPHTHGDSRRRFPHHLPMQPRPKRVGSSEVNIMTSREPFGLKPCRSKHHCENQTSAASLTTQDTTSEPALRLIVQPRDLSSGALLHQQRHHSSILPLASGPPGLQSHRGLRARHHTCLQKGGGKQCPSMPLLGTTVVANTRMYTTQTESITA